MAHSIRIGTAGNSKSEMELRERRWRRLESLALIAAGTLALLLIMYATSEPTVQPAQNGNMPNAPTHSGPMDARR